MNGTYLSTVSLKTVLQHWYYAPNIGRSFQLDVVNSFVLQPESSFTMILTYSIQRPRSSRSIQLSSREPRLSTQQVGEKRVKSRRSVRPFTVKVMSRDNGAALSVPTVLKVRGRCPTPRHRYAE
ncbi:hypothetical protein J6590_030027 [Homalodisca vitripennis]|nr:hypothetical protein J6590_030027 [Homalodisca vitripennis]